MTVIFMMCSTGLGNIQKEKKNDRWMDVQRTRCFPSQAINVFFFGRAENKNVQNAGLEPRPVKT